MATFKRLTNVEGDRKIDVNMDAVVYIEQVSPEGTTLFLTSMAF